LNLSAALTELELGLQNVVKITIFVKELSKFTHVNQIERRYFQFNFPVRTTVQVSALPLSVAVEMEFIVDAK
jgi:2-iminobutanoate/2-iminopropanoate deaminase